MQVQINMGLTLQTKPTTHCELLHCKEIISALVMWDWTPATQPTVETDVITRALNEDVYFI